MRVAVHRGPVTPANTFTDKWVEELDRQGIDVVTIDFRGPQAIEKIRGCDGAMWHWLHTPDDKQSAPKILGAIELGLGIPVLPNCHTAWHYDEKVAQHYLFQSSGVPAIRSWVFWDYDEALAFTLKCSYPIVFKLSVGAGSANVIKVESQKEAETLVRRIFGSGVTPYTMNEYSPVWFPTSKDDLLRLKSRVAQRVKNALFHNCPPRPHYYMTQKNYAYFQEFLPDNDHDIRVTVIGNRAWGYTRQNRSGDFRASGSGLIDYDPKRIPEEAVRMAHDISTRNKFQCMAYDFLRSPDGSLLVNEISYSFVESLVHNCPGYWDSDLVWHDGHVWPEAAQVDDLIAEIILRKSAGGRIDSR